MSAVSHIRRSQDEIATDLRTYLEDIYRRCPYAEQNHMICLSLLHMDKAPFDVVDLYHNMFMLDQEKLEEAFESMRADDDIKNEYIQQLGQCLKKSE